MSEPTLYFPEGVYWRLGLKQERQWSTTLSPGPTGRAQRRRMWIRPKRRMIGQVWPTTRRGVIHNAGDFGNNDPGSGPPKLTDDDMFALEMRTFLDNIAGQYTPFYIFDPVGRSYWLMRVGGWNGAGLPLKITWPDDLPFKFPFRGELGLASPTIADVTGIILVPVIPGTGLQYVIGDFTVDTSGAGNETRLTAIAAGVGPDPTPPSAEYYMYVSVKNAHERIPVVMTSDLDDFNFDFNNATPVQEVMFNLEEYFG